MRSKLYQLRGFWQLSVMMLTMFMVTSCTDETVDSSVGTTELTISGVNVSGASTRSIITDSYLPSGSKIGVAVFDSSGDSYDDRSYNNALWASSGTGSSQTWSPMEETAFLSGTSGTVYAYYPYVSGCEITSIPMDMDDMNDFMYATPVSGVSLSSPTASLSMSHVCATITLRITAPDYTGTGKLTKVSISGPLGSAGTLDATSGEVTLTSYGSAETLSQAVSLTVSDEETDITFLVLPYSTGEVTITLTVDGSSCSMTTESLHPTAGYNYIYDIEVSDGPSLNNTSSIGWVYNSDGESEVSVASAVVTIGGDLDDLAVSTAVSGATMTITAKSFSDGKSVQEADVSGDCITDGTCTVTQTEDEDLGTLTIKLINILSDIYVSMNGAWWNVHHDGDTEGLTYTQTRSDDGNTVTIVITPQGEGTMVSGVTGEGEGTLTQSLNSETGVRTVVISDMESEWTITFNGVYAAVDVTVYAVDSDGELIDVDDADTDCIGVALEYGDLHRFMIEKYESQNTTSYESTTAFTWGGYGTDTSMSNYSSRGVSGSYLPDESGSYSNSYMAITLPPTAWTSGALSDFDGGVSHSEVLKTVTGNGSYSSSRTTIGTVLSNFLDNTDENQGYTDWYIPAEGQLALMYIYKTSINSALSAIGGYSLQSSVYWSSTEYSSSNAWGVNLSSGVVNAHAKYSLCRVRFVRDI